MAAGVQPRPLLSAFTSADLQALQIDATKKRRVEEAGNRAVNYYNQTWMDKVVSGPVQMTEPQRKAAESAIKAYEAGTSESAQGNTKAGYTDKALKAAVTTLNFITVFITPRDDVSETTKGAFKGAMVAGKLARAVTGLWNIFRGVLYGIRDTLKALGHIVMCVAQGDETIPANCRKIDAIHPNGTYSLNPNGKFYLLPDGTTRPVREDDIVNADGTITRRREVAIYNGSTKSLSVYRGRTEQMVGFFAMLGQAVGQIAYTVGFGALAPTKFVHDNCAKLGATAQAVGNRFPFVMFINHCGEILHCLADYVHEGMVYQKAKADDQAAVRNFYRNYLYITGFLAEKSFELAADIMFVVQEAAQTQQNALTKAGLHMAAGITSYYRERAYHHGSAENTIRKKAEEIEKDLIEKALKQAALGG